MEPVADGVGVSLQACAGGVVLYHIPGNLDVLALEAAEHEVVLLDRHRGVPARDDDAAVVQGDGGAGRVKVHAVPFQNLSSEDVEVLVNDGDVGVFRVRVDVRLGAAGHGEDGGVVDVGGAAPSPLADGYRVGGRQLDACVFPAEGVNHVQPALMGGVVHALRLEQGGEQEAALEPTVLAGDGRGAVIEGIGAEIDGVLVGDLQVAAEVPNAIGAVVGVVGAGEFVVPFGEEGEAAGEGVGDDVGRVEALLGHVADVPWLDGGAHGVAVRDELVETEAPLVRSARDVGLETPWGGHQHHVAVGGFGAAQGAEAHGGEAHETARVEAVVPLRDGLQVGVKDQHPEVAEQAVRGGEAVAVVTEGHVVAVVELGGGAEIQAVAVDAHLPGEDRAVGPRLEQVARGVEEVPLRVVEL